MTRRLGHLEVLFLCLMLVAVGAVDLLTLDLVLFIQVRLMDVDYLFCKFDLLSLELVIRLAVALVRHATFIDDSGPRLDRLTAQGDVGKTLWPFTGDVFTFNCGAGLCGLARLLGLSGRIVTLNAAIFVVFARFPGLVAFLNDTRIGQDMAVAAEELGFRGIRLGKVQLDWPLLIGS